MGNTIALIFSGGEIDTIKLYGLIGFLIASLLTIFVIVIMNEDFGKFQI